MRVVPQENEDVNECWISDKDRFSYEALNSAERLTTPMIKQGGEWKEVDWQAALEFVTHGLNDIKAQHGSDEVRPPESSTKRQGLVPRICSRDYPQWVFSSG